MFRRNRTRAGVAAAMALCAGPALPGCGFIEPKVATRPGAGISGAGVSATAPFEPVELRVHPLTEIRRSPERPAGDEATVHLELLDAWGDTVKALGRLTLEMRIEAPGFAGAGAGQTQVWELNLTDPAVNSQRFDRVTRTYRIRVRGAPRWDPARQRARLIATMTLPSGATLQGERVLDGPQ